MTREEAILLLNDMKDTYDEIHENTNYEIGYEQMTALDMAIEALQTEAERGEWIFNTDENNGKSWNICSNCGHSQFHETNYCPNCGAVMSVPIQHMELKKPFTVDEIPTNYEPRILWNVETEKKK